MFNRQPIKAVIEGGQKMDRYRETDFDVVEAIQNAPGRGLCDTVVVVTCPLENIQWVTTLFIYLQPYNWRVLEVFGT